MLDVERIHRERSEEIDRAYTEEAGSWKVLDEVTGCYGVRMTQARGQGAVSGRTHPLTLTPDGQSSNTHSA